MKKIALIGAGNIGGVLAYLASVREIGNIVLIDKKPGTAKAKALDICQTSSIYNFKCRVFGTSNPAAMQGADVVIVSAGVPRKKEQKRGDTLNINREIITEIANNIKEYAPDSFVIIITNPLDAMVYLTKKITGFPRNRIVGMSGILDSARFKSFIADELKITANNVNAIVIGGHNKLMVPVVSKTTVNKKPLTGFLSQEKINEIIERTKHAGEEIINLLGTSAYFAPATGAINIAESFLKDEKRLFPCSVYLEGEYNLSNICIGVPVKIGKNGVEEIIELELTDEEREDFLKSADSISQLIGKIN